MWWPLLSAILKQAYFIFEAGAPCCDGDIAIFNQWKTFLLKKDGGARTPTAGLTLENIVWYKVNKNRFAYVRLHNGNVWTEHW